MAYWIDNNAEVKNARQITFFMDSDSDVTNLPTSSTHGVQQGENIISCLPCGKGSVAMSIESSNIYMLNSANQWIKIGG